MKKLTAFLCATAIVAAALVSFIACSSPDADKNEVTPTVPSVPAAPVGTAKTQTVTVSLATPEADSRVLATPYEPVHLDYFELYFRNTMGDSKDTEHDGAIYFAKAVRGTPTINITIPAVPDSGVAYDVLLLAGKKLDGAAALLFANDYVSAVDIVPNGVTTITLNAKWLATRIRLFTYNPITGDGSSAVDTEWVDPPGYHDLHLSYIEESPLLNGGDDVSIYPVMMVDNLAPLLDAGLTTTTLTNNTWVRTNAAAVFLEAMGTTAQTNWSFPRATSVFNTVGPRYTNEATKMFTVSGGITINAATGSGTATIQNVLNTYGRLYGTIPVRPFGPGTGAVGDKRGVIWYIQGGAANYYNLEGADGTKAESAYGGLLIGFGDIGNLPYDEDIADTVESETEELSITLLGL
jgi:hypothetical protein